MAAQLSVESHREGAEIYTGAELCKRKSVELLEGLRLPRGLLPLEEMEEVGFNRAAGFVWLRQRGRTDHRFEKIGKTVSYAPEVTAFVEERRMKKMTGVKVKELLVWITLTEMFIDEAAPKRIQFKTPSGLGRNFPVAVFELEEEEEKGVEN